jgi:sirohydrochlorin cobaltochelatase
MLFFPARTVKARLCHITLLLAMLLVASQALAAMGGPKPDKRGILLVAFGTTYPDGGRAYNNIEAKVKEAFPGVDIRWAYSSSIIRHILHDKGKEVDSPSVALARMQEDGFTHVAVQSLQTIPGEEYNEVLETAKAFADIPRGFKQVEVGPPLMYATHDVERVADALMAAVPAERKPADAVIFVGHGTSHPGNIYYPGLQYFLAKKDPLALIGTVEGFPTREDVLTALKAKGVKKAWLVPFLAVAGDHVHNDIAGDGPQSWKSVLDKAGVESVPVMKGTGEDDPIVAIWVDHLKLAMSRFK